MTSPTPKKKQKRRFREYAQPDMTEAYDLHRRNPASLIERISCVIGCALLGDPPLLTPVYTKYSFDKEILASVVMIRESLPLELQWLPQYWLSKEYLSHYRRHRNSPDITPLPRMPDRRTITWLLNPWNLQPPPCIVEGYRWLEWKGYKHALQGPLKANRWIYLSPVSKNILIHGIWGREWLCMDSARISISVRRGASQPWTEKVCFQFFERITSTLLLEVLSLADSNKAIWPFSFPLPNPPQGLIGKYKLIGNLTDLSAPASTMYWVEVESGLVRQDQLMHTPSQASKIGTEVMLWLKWVLGLDVKTTEKENHMKYPWVNRLILPSFHEDDPEVELAHRARWTHSVTVLDKPHTKPVPKNTQSFRADV